MTFESVPGSLKEKLAPDEFFFGRNSGSHGGLSLCKVLVELLYLNIWFIIIEVHRFKHVVFKLSIVGVDAFDEFDNVEHQESATNVVLPDICLKVILFQSVLQVD